MQVIPFIKDLHERGFDFAIEPFTMKDIMRKEIYNRLSKTT